MHKNLTGPLHTTMPDFRSGLTTFVMSVAIMPPMVLSYRIRQSRGITTTAAAQQELLRAQPQITCIRKLNALDLELRTRPPPQPKYILLMFPLWACVLPTFREGGGIQRSRQILAFTSTRRRVEHGAELLNTLSTVRSRRFLGCSRQKVR